MVFTRKKSRSDADPESPPRTQPEINIREVHTPCWKVVTQEGNELFVQKVIQNSQDMEGEVLHYHGPFFNDSSTEDGLKEYYRTLALRSHSEKKSIHRRMLLFA